MATIEMIVPAGQVLYTFVPNETFVSDQFQSTYVAGARYSVRQGNTALDAAVHAWADVGRVTIE